MKELSSQVLEAELAWFQKVLTTRIEYYFQGKGNVTDALEIPPPEYGENGTFYSSMIHHYEFQSIERLILMLALVPEIRPELLDVFFSVNDQYNRGFSEFGGIVGHSHSGFIPTVETAFFLISGGNLPLRMQVIPMFQAQHVFQHFHILDLEHRDKDEPEASAVLKLNRDVRDMILLSYIRDPETNADFPAKRLYTGMEWEDIVFAPQTEEQLKELQAWLKHENELLEVWQFRKYLKAGYRCLFYGPPGTGKTLTASLLGKVSNRPVYRIDLSQLVSKYIGETEKNLEKIFVQAEQRNWILFFDEADSIFGKRTSISDSHDRYANQGTSYLLQRIEDCPNVVILATNNKTNIDEAFYRRFQSTVFFPMPRKAERLILWKRGFSPVSTLEASISLEEIADRYEMAGGAIMNVIRYSSLMAISRETRTIAKQDLMSGIQREFNKEGRTL